MKSGKNRVTQTADFSLGGHKWEKANAVTLSDGKRGMYDEYECALCHLRARSYQLGTLELNADDVTKLASCTGPRRDVRVRVKECTAFSPAFDNITPGSVHEIVPAPEGQQVGAGEWVMGMGQPVLLLPGEYEYTIIK